MSSLGETLVQGCFDDKMTTYQSILHFKNNSALWHTISHKIAIKTKHAFISIINSKKVFIIKLFSFKA